MRKIALFLNLCVFIWASDLQQALEHEKQGDYKKLWKFTKTRFKKFICFDFSRTKQLKPNNTNAKFYHYKKEEKQDFSRLALANYLGENESFNPLGISSYKMNYFLPFAYSFNSLGTNNNKSEAKFQLSVKKDFLKIY